ncbi:hypothetical protein [Kitasatospora sp. NPDC057223]
MWKRNVNLCDDRVEATKDAFGAAVLAVPDIDAVTDRTSRRRLDE